MVRLRPNWSSSFEDFLPSPPPAAGALAASAGAGEHPDDLVADLLGVGVEVEQDAGGDALVLTHQAEQDVLGADVVVAERERLAQRQLEHLLGARREGDLAGGDLLAGADDPDHLRADALDGDVEGLEHAGGQALLLAKQAEQDVLGADVVVLEGPRLLLGEDDYLAGSLCESLEHSVSGSLVYQAVRLVLRCGGRVGSRLRGALEFGVRGRRLPGGPIRIGSCVPIP